MNEKLNKLIFAVDTPDGSYQEVKEINDILDTCESPYVDVETLRIKAEMTWP